MAQDAAKLAEQAERLRELKAQAGRSVTFKKIADAASVTERQAQRWFAGESDPEPDNLKALAKYFGTTPDYIEYGRIRPRSLPTPELVQDLSSDADSQAQLERIERKVEEVDRKLDEILKRLAPAVEPGEGDVAPPARPQPPLPGPTTPDESPTPEVEDEPENDPTEEKTGDA